jgi:oligopeptide transport system substrate-binding protein
MRSRSLPAQLILIAALISLACKLSVQPTASPRATRPPAPTQAPQVYNNPDYGVTITYPAGWSTEQNDQAGLRPVGAIIYIVSPGQKIRSVLFYEMLANNETLQDAAAQVRDSVLKDMQGTQILRDEGLALEDGSQAWITILTSTSPNSTDLKISLVTVLYGERLEGLYTFMVFGPPQEYDAQQGAIEAMIASLHVETASLYGVPREQALVQLGGESTNPRNYDPATTPGSGDKMVFSGLVAFDPQLNLVPDLAATWEVKDGVVYTFILRSDARFHDGRPVTSQDVIYSWERAADPTTASDTVLTYLGDIVGVKERQAGKAEAISGLKALDEHTLQVTIDAPKPYFLLKLTYAVAFVLDHANVESGTEWYRTPNGTGPYKLIRWDRFQVMVYERNEDYYLELPAIRYIVIQLYSGVGIRLYEAGEIDITGVSLYNVPRILDPQEPLHADLISGANMCTSYVTFDVSQPPFDDLKVRQAFTMAFDRQKYIDVVLRGASLPADGPFPPGLPGYNADLAGLPYDPERARQLLAESKYDGPEGLPPIVYTSSGFGSEAGSSISAMAQMWQQNLGITITVENLETNLYRDELHAGRHGQLFDTGWCADYPDPENFADALFHSDAQQNLGHYSNPELDDLLEQARVEQDVSHRIRLYQQAEQIIVNDAPVLFTVHSMSYVLVKPYIRGYVLTPIDVPLERYLWIDPSKR